MSRVFFKIGNITIYYYSLLMVIAVVLGLYLAYRESKKYKLEKYISDLSTYLIIFGIIGARFYYVIFKFDSYKNSLLDIFKIWEGGIAIYGAIIGGLLTMIYYSHKYKKNLLDTTDIYIPGLILGQAIGRWGNFFNHEAYGSIVSLDFLNKLHIPNFIINEMYIDGAYHHPTFLYESLWCLLGFIIMITIRKLFNRKRGIVTYSYFIWYGIGRFLIEGLRTDSLYLFNIRISQLVSIILIIIGIVGIIYNFWGGKKNEKEI